MAGRELVLLCSGDIPDAVKLLEVSSFGSGYSNDATVLPPTYPVMALTGHFAQDKYCWARTYPVDFSTGTAAGSRNHVRLDFYIRDTAGPTWPPNAPIEIFAVMDTTLGDHLTVRIDDNGTGVDKLVLVDDTGAVVATATDVFELDTWYRLDVLFELANTDGGAAGGDVEVYVTPFGGIRGAAKLTKTGGEFWLGSSGDLLVRLEGQRDVTLTYPVTVHWSTLAGWKGNTSAADMPDCDMAVIIGASDHTGVTGEADENGNVGASDDLTAGREWEDAVDASFSSYAACAEVAGDDAPFGGTVECPEPASVLHPTTTIYGATWCWRVAAVGAAERYVVWGFTDGSDPYDEVNQYAITATGFALYDRIIRDVSSPECPSYSSRFIYGLWWNEITTAARSLRLNEIRCEMLVRYPLDQTKEPEMAGVSVGRLGIGVAAKAFAQLASMLAGGVPPRISANLFMRTAAACLAGSQIRVSVEAFMQQATAVAAGMENAIIAKAFMRVAEAVAAELQIYAHEPSGDVTMVMELMGVSIQGLGPLVQAKLFMATAAAVMAGAEPAAIVRAYTEMTGATATGCEAQPLERVGDGDHVSRRGRRDWQGGKVERERLV